MIDDLEELGPRGVQLSSIRQLASTGQITTSIAATLRHDLVTPINLIVGYCELLIADSTDQGRTNRLPLLQAIRRSGFTLLNLIDQTLLTEATNRSVADLRVLSASLVAPGASLINSCDSLLQLTRADPEVVAFAADLRKIRSAGIWLSEMAREIAVDHFHQSGPPQPDPIDLV